MPNNALAARYDLPWKTALSHALRPFMDFFFPDISCQINWKQRPRFRDKELAGVGLGVAPDVMVADKLVEVCLCDGGEHWELIHIEIQAQRDAALAHRVFDYNYRICKEYGLPVVSLVILGDSDPNWRPTGFRDHARGTVTAFSFRAVKLLDYADDISALADSHNPIAWVLLAHLLTLQAHRDSSKRYAAKLHLTRLLFKHRWSAKRIIVLFNVVNWMMVLPELLQKRYLQEVLQQNEEYDMKELTPFEEFQQWVIEEQRKKFLEQGLEEGLAQGRKLGLELGLERGLEQGLERGLERGLEQGRKQGLEQGRKQGLEQGRKQGLEQGRKEGAVALLERQLMRRFGPLPQTVQKKLANASLAQVDAWSEALFEATSLKQVFNTAQ